ncbi:4Fe-4S binding protein [Sporomusa malonica]|uniref:4Fe-4S binding protein n=1 Tax=Sporomusa malonica TaxID=112901 RepID=UPI000A07031C
MISVNLPVSLLQKSKDLAYIQEEVPETLKNHYDLLEHRANECIECGLCIKNCPFGVDVINKMKQAIKVFGKLV